MSNTASVPGSIESEGVLVGTIEQGGILVGSISIPTTITPTTEEKTVTPSDKTQVILPSQGSLISKVTVNPIPNTYGLITYNGFSITVS